MSTAEKTGEWMEREGVFQIRRWTTEIFTVEMTDKRTGQGKTIREAINNASHERLAG